MRKALAMKIARFRRLLDTYGSDLSRWPPLPVQAARRLISSDPVAARELAIARHLDALIGGYMQHEPTGTAQARDVMAQRTLAALGGALPPQQRDWMTGWLPAVLLEFDFAPAWPRMAALAGIAGLGFMVGLSDLNLPGVRGMAASSGGTDSDLSMIVFDQDPLSGLRP
jgi:hypothetical protein